MLVTTGIYQGAPYLSKTASVALYHYKSKYQIVILDVDYLVWAWE